MKKSARNALLEAACNAMRQAYCPYSGYAVGAALLTKDGSIYCGCNVENASFGLTVCAERNAVAAAVMAGRREFAGLAIVTGGDAMPWPCGACRQVLSEFAAPAMPVLTARASQLAKPRTVSFSSLLPHSFTFKENNRAGVRRPEGKTHDTQKKDPAK